MKKEFTNEHKLQNIKFQINNWIHYIDNKDACHFFIQFNFI